MKRCLIDALRCGYTHYTIECAPGAMPFASRNVFFSRFIHENSRNILFRLFASPTNKIWMKNQKQKRRRRNNQRKRKERIIKLNLAQPSSAGICPVTPLGRRKKKRKMKAPTATLVTRPGSLMATYSVARRRRIGRKRVKEKLKKTKPKSWTR